MRIAVIAPIAVSIPPEKYGGTERVIYYLVEGLVKRGHDVTLFASGDTKTSARLVSVVDQALSKTENSADIYGFNTPTMLNIGLAYSMQDQFDVIHDHGPHLSLPTANIARTPTVQTWHGPFLEPIVPYFEKLNKPYIVSISKAQQKSSRHINFIGTVYNGLPMAHYPFNDKPEDYLLFVGRIDREKGPHLAIDVAVKLGKKLIIAAKVDLSVPIIKEYFEQEVKPRLEKHKDLVEWIGEVDEKTRNDLMKNALCLLHPITWPEPFGLTIIEAMSCGCPVVANNFGSMQEIIKHGKTGYIVNNLDEMLDAVKNIGKINRMDCRQHSLENFNDDRMVEGYLDAYQRAIKFSAKTAREKANESKHKRYGLFLEFSPGNN
jgi:glycosyltransferase involved in cell wall biosynthesis